MLDSLYVRWEPAYVCVSLYLAIYLVSVFRVLLLPTVSVVTTYEHAHYDQFKTNCVCTVYLRFLCWLSGLVGFAPLEAG